MGHIINDNFDRVVCINLAKRKDKKQTTQEKFDKVGIKVEWFEAVQYGFAPSVVAALNANRTGRFNAEQPNEFGCALSHYTVIKKAYEDGLDNIFVFEDDICFHKNFNARLDRYFNDLPGDWQMINLYSFMYELLPQNVRVNKSWIRSYKSWSMMAYGMKREVMKEYIRRQDAFFTISDAVTFGMQDSYSMYTAIPALCVPNPSLESNIRSVKNYENKITITNLGIKSDEYE
jgi:GR25 family glycosyltransferase involved in LPS biosynthesis